MKRPINERIFHNLPEDVTRVDPALEAALPTGWFLNYCDVFSELISHPAEKVKAPVVSPQLQPNPNKKNKGGYNQQLNQNPGKKNWNPVEFFKLQKKFEDLTSKALEEPKEDEAPENFTEFVAAKNFISRMRTHCLEVSNILCNLSQNGYFVFRENLSEGKCKQLCELFTIGGEFRLKPIPCDFKVKDYAARLSPAYTSPAKKS